MKYSPDPRFISWLIRQQNRLIALALGVLFYGLYQAATAPSVATIFDDSLEFPLVVHRLAIAHPTGYPLYTLLGKLFSFGNPTNVAYQVNLMSAFFGALTVAVFYLVVIALTQASPAKISPTAQQAGAVIGATVFGLGPIFFSQATIAEVYTLNAFFLATILLLTVQKQWVWLAWWLGLSLTHHRTMVLAIPAILIFAWVQDRPTLLRKKTIGLLFAGLLLPQMLYLYLPLRGHVGSLDGSYENSWAGFWRHILGGGYGSTFLGNDPFVTERTFSFYGNLIQQEIGWTGLILAASGLAGLLYFRKWLTLLLTGGIGLTFFTFNVMYGVADIEVFFIPVFLIVALWAGLGTSYILNWRWFQRPIICAIITLIALVGLFARADGQSRANDWAVHDYAQDVLQQPLPPNGTIIGILGEMTLLRYFQETASLRPDLATVAADLDSIRLQQLTQHLETEPDQPVFLTRPLAGVEQNWSLSAFGPLIQVQAAPPMIAPTPDPTVAIQQTVNLPLSAEISLVHYAISRPATHQIRSPVRLTVTWQVQAKLEADYKISARLVDSQGAVLASRDKIPVHFAYPTSAWRAGEFITDVYDIPLPDGAISGEYNPLLILYDPANHAAEVGRVMLPATYIQ